MATSDAPLSVPNVTLAVARSAAPVTPGVPSISLVTDNGDGTLTVSGSEFGSKAQAAPVKFERFEGTAGQRLSDIKPEWVAYQDGGTTIRNERSHSGTTCVGNTKPEAAAFRTNYFIYPLTDVVRVSYWVYYDRVTSDDYRAPGEVATQIKNTRITSSAAAGGGGVYNGTGDMAFGGFILQEGSGEITRNNGVEVLRLSEPSRYFGMHYNAWNRVDMMLKLSTPGEPDGEMRAHRCAALGADNKVWKNVVTRGLGETFQQNATILGVMIVNYSSEFGNPLSVFIDDVYVDTTWASIEIGDNPDYYACTRRDHCKPTSWSGSSLTVEKNFDHIPAGANYLFVMNEAGEVNATGYEVTI